MARQEANEQFQITSFLDGANAAYIEQLYARYEDDPNSVDDQWRSFFKALEEDPADVKKAAKGASWRKKNWPLQASGDLVSALDGDWGIVEKVIETKVKAKAEAAGQPANAADVLQATRDSVRAIMHKIQDRPVVVGGQIVIRPMMYLALSYDHRIVDGKEAVTFLVRVKESLEDPERLVLDL